MSDERDEPLPPPPEPPPLPEAPLGPPSMADEPLPPPAEPPPRAAEPPPPAPQAQPLPPPPQPPPPTGPPAYAPPPAPAPPPAAPAPAAPPPVASPSTVPPPAYPPPPAPGPSTQQQLGWTPPPYQPPAPAQKGPHGQPVFNGVECATWGSRVGAWLLDLLFMFLPLFAGIVLAAAGGDAVDVVGGLLIVGGLVWAYLLYAPLLMARSAERNGQTWGKQIVGIRVVRDGGETMSFGYAFLREFIVRQLLFGVIGGLFFLPPILDCLWPLWDESNRALHDMVVSTHVVRAQAPSGLPG